MTQQPTIAAELAAIVRSNPLEIALRSVEPDYFELAYEPRPWPSRPSALSMHGHQNYLELAARVSRGENQGDQNHDTRAMQAWMCQRASIRSDNERRLRGLLWCIQRLEQACDDGDTRAPAALAKARKYLTSVWDLAVERHASLQDRNALAEDCVRFMHERNFR